MNANEEVANSLTHLTGAFISLWMSYFVCTSLGWNWVYILYCLAPIWMFVASTMYHAERVGETKMLLRKIDHISIYFTITFLSLPICIHLMKSNNTALYFIGLATLCFQLFCTALGTIFKIFTTGKYRGLSTTIYIIFGWSSILPVIAVFPSLTTMEIAYAFGCGILFTIGGVFYSLSRIVYFHAIWHIFCILGIMCHYWFVISFLGNK